MAAKPSFAYLAGGSVNTHTKNRARFHEQCCPKCWLVGRADLKHCIHCDTLWPQQMEFLFTNYQYIN